MLQGIVGVESPLSPCACMEKDFQLIIDIGGHLLGKHRRILTGDQTRKQHALTRMEDTYVLFQVVVMQLGGSVKLQEKPATRGLSDSKKKKKGRQPMAFCGQKSQKE